MNADLDLERLRMLADLGRRTGHDLLNEILVRFEDAATVDRAVDAIRAADVETATLHLHSLKGSAANLGARQLSRLAAELEVEVRSGKTFEALESQFDDLRGARQEALGELNRFIASQLIP